MSADVANACPDITILLINQQNGRGMATINKTNFWLIVVFGVRSEGATPQVIHGKCAAGALLAEALRSPEISRNGKVFAG